MVEVRTLAEAWCLLLFAIEISELPFTNLEAESLQWVIYLSVWILPQEGLLSVRGFLSGEGSFLMRSLAEPFFWTTLLDKSRFFGDRD